MKKISISSQDLIRNTTLSVVIHVTGVKFLSVRIFIGSKLMKLAAWVIGCGISIEVDE